MLSQFTTSASDEIIPVIKKHANTKNIMAITRCVRPFFRRLQIAKMKNVIPNSKAATNTQSMMAEKDPSSMTYGIAYKATPIPNGAMVKTVAITPQIRWRMAALA